MAVSAILHKKSIFVAAIEGDGGIEVDGKMGGGLLVCELMDGGQRSGLSGGAQCRSRRQSQR